MNKIRLLAIAIVVGVTFAAALALAQSQRTVVPPQALPFQRFTIYQYANARADQYLLDTQTGRVWEMVADKDGVEMWQEMAKDNLK